MTKLDSNDWVIQVGHSRDGLRNYAAPVNRRGMSLCIIDSVVGEPSRKRGDLLGEGELEAIVVVEETDPAAIVNAAIAFARDHLVAQVVPRFELFTYTAALVRHALGLPGPSPDVLALFRSKAKQRAAMAAGNVPQSRSVACQSLDDARRAVGTMIYPVVVKPDDAGGSQGVRVVRNAEQLGEAYAAAINIVLDDGTPSEGLVLIEEFVPGEELGVSGVVDKSGAVRIIGVTERMIYRGKDESSCLILRDVACPPNQAPAAVRSVVESAIQALKLRSSPFDMDVRMPDPETALVIECGARITGGSVPACYRHIGIDLGDLALSAVLGETAPGKAEARNGGRFCGQEYLVQGTGSQASRQALSAREMLAGERGEVIIFAAPVVSGDYSHISGRFGIARAVAASVDRVHAVLDLILLDSR